VEVRRRLAHGLLRIGFQARIVEKAVAETPAAAGMALFAPATVSVAWSSTLSTPDVFRPNLLASPVRPLALLVVSVALAVVSFAFAVVSVTRSTAPSAILTPEIATAIGFSRFMDFLIPSSNF
jgi:hypothetical protein